MNPKLTVAIPTYNRVEQLSILLHQLLKQNEHSFNILVSDDGSTDQTETLIKKLQKKHKNLLYNKNKTNKGYSGNVSRLYELATTPYIWFLCDDDAATPDALSKVFRVIRKYQPTVAIFNYTWIDAYGRRMRAFGESDIFYTKKTALSDYQPLMRLTFLSTLLMRRGPSITSIKKTNYENNIFFQISLGLHLLSKRFRFLESSSVILHREVGYNYGEFFKSYMTDHLDAVYNVKHSFDNEKFILWSRNQILTALSVYLSQKLGLFSYRKNPSKKTQKKLKKYYGTMSYFILLFPYLYALTPTILIQYIYLIRLVYLHGINKAKRIMKKNLNRAQDDKRSSGFLENK